MKECGVVPSDLDRIAEAENKRLTSKEPNPFHKFPEHSAERGEKRRGRPKGSVKNGSIIFSVWPGTQTSAFSDLKIA